MEPTPVDIARLALYDPIAAYGLMLGIKRLPIHLPVAATFSSFTVPQAPIVGDLAVTIANRTWIQKINYSLSQPNEFAGNIFKPLYDACLKYHPGISVQVAILGGPRYVTAPAFVPLENVADLIDPSWPAGWVLQKQQSIQVQFQLTDPPSTTSPNGPPYTVNMTFTGWQFEDPRMDDVSHEDAIAALQEAGICTLRLCKPPKGWR